jgi:hypothetical protein
MTAVPIERDLLRGTLQVPLVTLPPEELSLAVTQGR